MNNDQNATGVVEETNASEGTADTSTEAETGTVATEEGSEANESKETEAKPKFSKEEILAIRKREVKRLERELGVESEDKSEKSKKSLKVKSDDLGFKAYLKVNGINADEVDLFTETMQDTGKSPDELLGAKWFMAELKERRDAKAVDNAVPTRNGGRNNVTPASRTVEHWLAKGDFELPENKPENRQLINQVIEARLAAKRSGY